MFNNSDAVVPAAVKSFPTVITFLSTFCTTVEVSARKLYADGAGEEAEAPLSTGVLVGLYPGRDDSLGDDDLPAPLLTSRKLLKSGDNRWVLRSSEAPVRVVVDPQLTLIDRDPSDNERSVSGV